MKIYNNKNRNTIKMASIVMTATIGIVSVIGLTASVFNKPEKEPVKDDVEISVLEELPNHDTTGVIKPLKYVVTTTVARTTQHTTTTTKPVETTLSSTGTISPSTTISTTETATQETEGAVSTVEEVAETTTEAIATTTTTTSKAEETTTVTTEPIVEEEDNTGEYIVYKPSTHYVHRSTCHWFNSECVPITSTEGLEARICTECNPDIEIVTQYQEPQPVANNSGYTSLNYITDTERIYLCNTVGSEYGSDWVPLYDKACVVATVMNRVHDGGWSDGLPSTIYNVLTARYQYNPAYAVGYYRKNVTQSCIDAVEYYFEHMDQFPHYTSFWGDGTYNHFS
jgi:hypothetical protein